MSSGSGGASVFEISPVIKDGISAISVLIRIVEAEVFAVKAYFTADSLISYSAIADLISPIVYVPNASPS